MVIYRPWLAYTFDGQPSSSGLFTDLADGEQPLLMPPGYNASLLNILTLSGGTYGQVQGNPWTGDAMTFTFRARFESLNPWSRVFDFGDGPDTNNIIFGNEGTTNNATFRIIKNGVTYVMTLPDAIEVGTDQIWTISVDASGLARVSYTEGTIGTAISVVTATAQMVRIEPDQRTNMFIGRSNWAGDGPFHGAIDNFFVYNYAMSYAQVLEFIPEAARMHEPDNSFGASLVRHWIVGQVSPSSTPNAGGADETLNGTEEADVLFPNGGIDTVNGFGGDDHFSSNPVFIGRTTFNGGSGSDTVIYTSLATSELIVDLQNLSNNSAAISGDAYIDIENVTGLKHTPRNDLRGNSVGNILTGGDGNDLLRGRGGADTLKGNGGALDTADYSDSSQPVRANLLLPSTNLNDAAGDVYDDIHALRGSAFGDVLIGDNRTDGRHDDVRIPYWSAIGVISNRLEGGDGDDTLYGAGGRDVIEDGLGNDTVYGDWLPSQYGFVSPSDYGDDVIFVGRGNNNVYADSGDDIILQTAAITSERNLIQGDAGNDIIGVITTGAASIDTYRGGDGFDLLHYGYTEASASFAQVDLLAPGNNAGMATNDVIVNIEGLRGSRTTNTFFGSNESDLLIGGGGQDVLHGRGGADILVAGEVYGFRTQLITVGSGAQSMRNAFNALYDTPHTIFSHTTFVSGDAAGGQVLGHAGNDSLLVSRNARMNGGADNDEFYLFDPTGAAIDGDAGSDTLILPLALEYMYGTLKTFDYTINLGSSGGHVVNASGFTLANIENVVGGHGNDTLRGAGTENTLSGGRGVDRLYGLGGIDRLEGGQDADTLDGGTEADTLIGGAGDDTYYVDRNGDVVLESFGAGTDVVRASASYVLTPGQAVEKLMTVNSTATAPINLTGNEFVQLVSGNAGANTLDGGGSGDTLYGYGGDDVYFVDQKGDFVFENVGNGKDHVRASASYILREGQEVETLSTVSNASMMAINLTGNGFGQTLIGNAAANTLDGKGGADWLYGLGGDDTYFVGDPGDVVIEAAGGGNDRVRASGTFSLTGNQEVEMLSTMSTTSAGAIDLTGSGFGQSILGNAGANKLDGKGGRDSLYGYGGADSFAFSSTIGSDHRDYIRDFSRTDDTILLSKTIFTVLGLGQLTQSAFKDLKAPGNVLDDDDRILYDRDSGLLSYDRDGVGTTYAAVQFAVVTTKPVNLDHTDFEVIA